MSEFLEQAPSGVSAVHLGNPDASITWVASSELPQPWEFLSGGELLLTTGLFATSFTPSQWDRYVQGLVAAGVLHLGFGVGIAFPDVPSALVNACRHRNINVVRVAEAVPFVTISRRFAHMALTGTGTVDNSAAVVTEELSKAAVKGSTLGLLRALARALHGDAAIMDRDGAIIHGPVGAGHFPTRDMATELSRVRRQRFRLSVNWSQDGEHCALIPLLMVQPPPRFLAVRYSGALATWQRSILTLTTSLLGVVLSREPSHGLTPQESALVGKFLISRNLDAAAETLRLLKGQSLEDLGISPRLRVACYRGDDPPPAPIRYRHDDTTILIGPPDFLSDISRKGHASERIGIGRVCSTSEAARGLHEAEAALTMCDEDSPVIVFSETPSLPSLLSAVPPNTAQALSNLHLSRIIDDQELTNLARSYLRNNGSPSAIAQECGIHRNTIRHRISQLQRAIGADLCDPGVRAHLWFALQIHDRHNSL